MMKMAGLCWGVVTLTLLLSGENTFAAVDKNQLADIVEFIMNRYNIKTQVSVAANIPEEKTQNYLEDVFLKATADAVGNKVSQDSVYPGDGSDTKVVVAKPAFKEHYTDHAEALVLENIQTLINSRNGNFLFFYSFYSPCGSKCTNIGNKHNIISKINDIIPKWEQYAFVFFKVFDKTSKGVVIDRNETFEALKQLGNSKIGHNNIFRCYKPKNNNNFQCISCFNGKQPEEQCVVNEK